jgi:hypothetical protein
MRIPQSGPKDRGISEYPRRFRRPGQETPQLHQESLASHKGLRNGVFRAHQKLHADCSTLGQSLGSNLRIV